MLALTPSTIKEVLIALTGLTAPVFVVSTMLSLGLSLTLPQILRPLKDTGLVLRVVLANFVLVPLVAYLLITVIPLDPSLGIGLMLLATASGAPILPKLAQISKSNVPLSVGLTVLLMVVTVFYVPVVLPVLLPGVEVSPGEVARSLVTLMLIPLAIGLVVYARYRGIADWLKPYMAQVSNASLLAVLVLTLVVNFQSVLSLAGSGALLSTLLLIAASLIIGYWLGGPAQDTQVVSALGTARRNGTAAVLVATDNFSDDPEVLTMVLAASLLMLVVVLPLAGQIGRKAAT